MTTGAAFEGGTADSANKVAIMGDVLDELKEGLPVGRYSMSEGE